MIYRIVIATALLTFSVLCARWLEEGDYYDPVRGRHHCPAPPSAIADWSYAHRQPRPSDQANLDRWIRRHSDQLNRRFGVWCTTALHTAARFGRDDLAERLLASGADVGARDEPDARSA